MLRKFVAPLGRDEDAYIHWVKRATHIAEERAFALGFESFLDAFLRKKWHWAGHVARMDSQRWARRLTEWRDNTWWQEVKNDRGRPVHAQAGRQFAKWEDDLVHFGRHMGWDSWIDIAKHEDKISWNGRSDDFIRLSLRSLGK